MSAATNLEETFSGPYKEDYTANEHAARGRAVHAEATRIPFSRQGIIDAYVAFALVNAEDEPFARAAWAARVEKVRRLSDVRGRGVTEGMTSVEKACAECKLVDSISEDSRKHYFALISRRLGDAAAFAVWNRWECSRKKDGVTVCVTRDSDDPMRVNFDVFNPIATLWADNDQSIDGSSWEMCDKDCAVTSTTWHPRLIEELQAEGYSLDLSEYFKPSEEELAIDAHRWSCETCCDGEYRDAKRHYAVHGLERFALALMVIAHMVTWVEPTLFPLDVVYPDAAGAMAEQCVCRTCRGLRQRRVKAFLRGVTGAGVTGAGVTGAGVT